MVLDEISSQQLALTDDFEFGEPFSTLTLSQFAVPGKQMLRQSQEWGGVPLGSSPCARERRKPNWAGEAIRL